jgi:hypothetical protein
MDQESDATLRQPDRAKFEKRLVPISIAFVLCFHGARPDQALRLARPWRSNIRCGDSHEIGSGEPFSDNIHISPALRRALPLAKVGRTLSNSQRIQLPESLSLLPAVEAFLTRES